MQLSTDVSTMMALCIAVPVSLLLTGLGIRVLIRAREASATTDALVGLYFVCMGIGAPVGLLANDPAIYSESAARYGMAIGHLVMSVGFGALYVFVWRCFGVRSGWRGGLAIVGCLALVVLFVVQGVAERYEPPGGAVLRVTALVRAGGLVWALVESLRYWQLMRRRVALGLGDQLVANRFLLWCLWMGGMLGAIAIAITVRFVLPDYGPGAGTLTRILVMMPVMLLSMMSAGALWLAFFAPSWYSRWLAGAGGAQAA